MGVLTLENITDFLFNGLHSLKKKKILSWASGLDKTSKNQYSKAKTRLRLDFNKEGVYKQACIVAILHNSRLHTSRSNHPDFCRVLQGSVA